MIHLLLVLTTAWSGFNAPVPKPKPRLGGGGPDRYGYRYIDSDTTAPEAPIYKWVNIRDVGTRITGLGDDNIVGPFPIGFSFPYYWYTVNSFYFGSNGYMTFGDNTMAASPFHSLPYAAKPNNTLAPLLSDLIYNENRPADFGKAWYWTNAALDTLIVEADSVPFWARDTANPDTGASSFEIILSRPDSAITFQYALISDTPDGSSGRGWLPTNDEVGIENVTGQIGLNYLDGNIPSRNMVHESLAVRFYPPASETMHVSDCATWQVMSENSSGIFILKNTPTTFWAKIRNTGNLPVAGVPLACVVRNASNAIVFGDTARIASLDPGAIDSVVFTRQWWPATNGVYTTRVNANLTGDMFHGNDTINLATRVVTYPVELQLDRGNALVPNAWSGNFGGMGELYTPPSYPCTVSAIKADLAIQYRSTGCTLMLAAPDGPGGGPGTLLARTVIMVHDSITPGWYQYDLSTPAVINSGSFFVCATSNGTNDPVYWSDSTKPYGHGSWEFTGVWARSRSAANEDVLMHAIVSGHTGVEELAPAVEPIALSARPNPFGGKTVIRFSRTVAGTANLAVYNTAGELVRTLKTTGTSVSWDGRDRAGKRLADGIYFAKLEEMKGTVLKVVLTR